MEPSSTQGPPTQGGKIFATAAFLSSLSSQSILWLDWTGTAGRGSRLWSEGLAPALCAGLNRAELTGYPAVHAGSRAGPNRLRIRRRNGKHLEPSSLELMRRKSSEDTGNDSAAKATSRRRCGAETNNTKQPLLFEEGRRWGKRCDEARDHVSVGGRNSPALFSYSWWSKQCQ